MSTFAWGLLIAAAVVAVIFLVQKFPEVIGYPVMIVQLVFLLAIATLVFAAGLGVGLAIVRLGVQWSNPIVVAVGVLIGLVGAGAGCVMARVFWSDRSSLL